MIFQPRIDSESLAQLIDALEALRRRLYELDVPAPLASSLARYVEARGAHMSTRIEGNSMSEREVAALFEGEPSAVNREARENLDYRDAARFAVQVADDPGALIDGGFIRALHFLTVRTTYPYDSAGQYRLHQNVVGAGSRVIYLPPPPTEVQSRMGDLIAWLREHRLDTHALILVAVAHAEFVKVHPFDDGNGRTARAISVYFMARGGWRLRGFVGVEQVFGEYVDEYRQRLNELGDRYPLHPPDLTEWVRWFLLRLREEVTLDLTVAEAYLQAVGEAIPAWLQDHDLPPRMAAAMGMLWIEGSVTSSAYARESRISGPTAAADLRRLMDLDQIRRVGRGRATRYEPVDPGMVLDRTALRGVVREALANP